MFGRRTAQLPGLAVVIRVDDVRVVAFRARLDVIAGDDQPALVRPVFELYAAARAGGVPRPIRSLDVRGDFPWLAPGLAVILGAGHKHPPRILAAQGNDVCLAIIAPVPRHQQPDDARLAVHHRARVAAGVARIVPDDTLCAPGAAIVLRPLHEQINITRVARTVLAALAKGQHRALPRDGQSRNAVRVVTALAFDIDGLPDGRGNGGPDAQHEGQKRDEHECHGGQGTNG